MADSKLYASIAETATSFVKGTDPNPAGSNKIDADRILSTRATECTTAFRPAYFTSTRPHLQKVLDNDGFIAHMSSMTPMLDTWAIDVREVFVDEKRLSAVVQVDYSMTPKGCETVKNDIVWFIRMNESGEKVVDAVEYVDAAASMAIFEMLKAKKASAQ